MLSTLNPLKPMIYGRRKGRPLRKTKADLILSLLPLLEFSIPQENFPFSLFKTSAPVWLEIGYGTGDHLISQMTSFPHCNFIGCEPFLGGIGGFLKKLASENLSLENIRLFTKDAQSLLKMFQDHSVEKIFLLFPDPWPKKRHIKRRFFQKDTLEDMVRILSPGGKLVLASDSAEYFEDMQRLILTHKELTVYEQNILPNSPNAQDRPFSWPMTRFENKAHREKRICNYMILQKNEIFP